MLFNLKIILVMEKLDGQHGELLEHRGNTAARDIVRVNM